MYIELKKCCIISRIFFSWFRRIKCTAECWYWTCFWQRWRELWAKNLRHWLYETLTIFGSNCLFILDVSEDREMFVFVVWWFVADWISNIVTNCILPETRNCHFRVNGQARVDICDYCINETWRASSNLFFIFNFIQLILYWSVAEVSYNCTEENLSPTVNYAKISKETV